VVNCVNLVTLDKAKVLRHLGNLPDVLMHHENVVRLGRDQGPGPANCNVSLAASHSSRVTR
jgi:hypothetical protein